MAISNVFFTGKSGMAAAKSGIATAGHNISNANTEGYSRQRTRTKAEVSQQIKGQGGPYLGRGTLVDKIERVNDQYLERQLREGSRDKAHFEEKNIFLRQVEDVFNEMNGEGLNRLMSRFFNDFRQLSNDPSSEAVRQSVRESSRAMTSDFRRLRSELEQIRAHIDSRVEGQLHELNQYADELKDINIRITAAESQGNEANDLQDRRDTLVKKMMEITDLATHMDTSNGMISVDIRNVGPLVTGPNVEKYHFGRSQGIKPEEGKAKSEHHYSVDNSLQIARSPHSTQYVTEQFQGGRLGALLQVRDEYINKVISRLDEMAHGVAQSVNDIHTKGFTRDGVSQVHFFKPMDSVQGAAGRIDLSDAVKNSTGNIAAGLQPHAPGDNRNALAIANLQNLRLFNDGHTTVDDHYNSIVSEIGVAAFRNKEALGQQESILTQLSKVREQTSGVSIDEETANLMQMQHTFDASARVIKVADEMLKTIIEMR